MKIAEFLALPESELITLKTLALSDNQLYELTLEQWDALGNALAQCQQLQTMGFSWNKLYKLTPEQWHALGNALAQCLNLNTLDLGANGLGKLIPEQWLALGNVLAQCPNLQTLHLNFNSLYQLTQEQLLDFGNALAQCKNLQILDLSNNDLGELRPAQWHAFSTLQNCFELQELVINKDSNKIGYLKNLFTVARHQIGGNIEPQQKLMVFSTKAEKLANIATWNRKSEILDSTQDEFLSNNLQSPFSFLGVCLIEVSNLLYPEPNSEASLEKLPGRFTFE